MHSGCVIGEIAGGGPGNGVEPPNPVVLKEAALIGAMDSYFSVFAGEALVTAQRRVEGGGASTDVEVHQVSDGSVISGARFSLAGSRGLQFAFGTRVFLMGQPMSSVDIASGDEVLYAGTENHGGIGVVGDALVTQGGSDGPAAFVSDLKAPQQPAVKIADGMPWFSGDALLVRTPESSIDVYRVHSPRKVVKEGTLPTGEDPITGPSWQNKLSGGKVVVRRFLPEGRFKSVVYAKEGTSFVEWYSDHNPSGSELILTVSGNLLLVATWPGKQGEGPATLLVVDVSEKGAPRELARRALEESSVAASEWSGQVAYVHTSSRLLAVDARDPNAVKFVDLYSGVLDVGTVSASGSTLALGVGKTFGTGHTVVFTMTDAPSGGVLRCATPNPRCFNLLRQLPNAFSNAFIYEPQYPLFSDGALKRRSIYLPPGQKVNTSDPDRWVFPKGTSILKEFYSAPASAGAVGAPLEARIWVKTGDAKGPGAWAPSVYLAMEGDWAALPRDPASTQYIDVGAYKVPHAGVCLTCHQGTDDVVLGFDALQLSGGPRGVLVPGKAGVTQPGSTLAQLNAVAFTQPVAETAIQGTAKAKAALGYLHSNCASCHSDTGLASGRTLRFKHLTTATTPQQEQGYATLTAGPNPKLIPGNPNGSIVVQRATSNMPPRFPATPLQTQDPVVGPVLSAWITELAQ